jgi:hypothetical protein
MKARLLLVLLASLVSAGPAAAQADLAEEMQFVQRLRAEGMHDLALDYLKGLAKNPSPELAKILPLEMARTQMVVVADEPDSQRRLRLYDEILRDFENFLKNNPGYAQTTEVRLDIARVTSLKGKTQLSRALIMEDPKARYAEGDKARATLVEAHGQLKKAAADLAGRLKEMPEPKTPAERAERARLEEEARRAELAVALNLVDQVGTYLNEGNLDVASARAEKVKEALKALDPLANGDITSPVTWTARAWLGRCYDLNGKPLDGRKKCEELLLTSSRRAVEARRLARYFWMLAYRQTVDPEDQKTLPEKLIAEGRSWVRDYPTYWNTPEGQGVRYLLAQTLVAQADALGPRRAAAKPALLAEARQRLREVERTENDFTDRARRLKFAIITRQGGFSRKVAELRSFDDCYTRAQYEVMMMGKDAEKITDNKELQKKREERTETILEALDRGLKMPDARGKNAEALEINNARALLAFYSLNAGKLEQAISVGESFARADPRSGQAATASVYALQAYNQLIAQKAAGGEDVQAQRDKMLALASYMETRWPSELAGNIARHQTGLAFLREAKRMSQGGEAKPEDVRRKYGEAIAKLSAVQKSYPSYAFARSQLADAALAAAKEGLEPAKNRTLGLKALRELPAPDPAGTPATNYIIMASKLLLGRELFKEKKYGEMEALVGQLSPLVDKARYHEEEERNATVRKAFAKQLGDLGLYAQYGLTKQLFDADKLPEVAARIDPLVEGLNKGEKPRLRENLPLALALVKFDLEANIRLRKPAQIQAALVALQALSGDDTKGTTGILKQLVVLIRQQVEELRKKGNEEELKKAVAGFTAVLDDIKGQPKLKLTGEVVLYLAHCYAGMDQHFKASDTLEKAPPLRLPGEEYLKEMRPPLPAEDLAGMPTKPDAELDAKLARLTPQERSRELSAVQAQIVADLKVYKAIRLLQIRELRLTEDKDNIAKAKKVLEEIQGPKRKGWGAKNLTALKEEVYLAAAREDYGYAAKLAQGLVKMLLPLALKDNALKEEYLECYYLLVFSYLRHSQGLNEVARRDRGIEQAAAMVVSLEEKWGGFGSPDSKERFEKLLEKDKEFKAFYDRQKKR